jgi:hypothetical protein
LNPETAKDLKYWLMRGGVEVNGRVWYVPEIRQLMMRSRKPE